MAMTLADFLVNALAIGVCAWVMVEFIKERK